MCSSELPYIGFKIYWFYVVQINAYRYKNGEGLINLYLSDIYLPDFFYSWAG